MRVPLPISLLIVGMLTTPKIARGENNTNDEDEPATVIPPSPVPGYLDPALAEDAIYVYGARPDKAYERDTKLRLTGTELRKRGIGNLAEALESLPEINVRAAGRGGRQIDIRGARKGSVKILLDGVTISDPYYGNIDLSSIPITDIEEIRVSSSPASPIDGTGGPGGVIEIFTSDAVGPDMVRARVRASSQPAAEVSVTGRTELTPTWGLRMSASAMLGKEEFELRLSDGMTSDLYSFFLSEERDQSVANIRLEYQKNKRRFVSDIWFQQVAFTVPPARDGESRFLVIEGESQGRLGSAYYDTWKGVRLEAQASYHLLSRQSIYFEDPQLTIGAQNEDLNAGRASGSILANRPIGESWHLIGSATLESENADVIGFDGVNTQGRSTVAQSALALQRKSASTELQASAGVALPLDTGSSPWAEFKVTALARPVSAVEFQITAGHKGRTPTLRERLRADIGNDELGPEKSYFGEMKISFTSSNSWRLAISNFLRRTNGLIRFDPDSRTLGNTKELWIRGIETTAEANLNTVISVGGNYSYADAHSEILGADPLDFFPNHRASAWLRLGKNGFGATTRIQYWSSQIDKNVELPPRLLLQATLHAKLADRYLLNLRVENLSGSVYEQRLGVRAQGRVVYASVQAEW